MANQKSFCERLTDIPWKNPNYYSENLDLYVRSCRLNKWPSCLQYNWLNKFYNKRLSPASSSFFVIPSQCIQFNRHLFLSTRMFSFHKMGEECFGTVVDQLCMMHLIWDMQGNWLIFSNPKYLSPLLIYVPLQLFMRIHESPWYTSQISWSFKCYGQKMKF